MNNFKRIALKVKIFDLYVKNIKIEKTDIFKFVNILTDHQLVEVYNKIKGA